MSFADETWLLWIMNRKRPPTAATITKCDNQFLQALYRARFFPFSFCLLLVTVLTCVCFMCVSSVDKSRWPFRNREKATQWKVECEESRKTRTKEMGTKVLIEMQQQLRHVVAGSENAPSSTKQLEDSMDVDNSIFLVFEDITYTARPWILSESKLLVISLNF